MRPPLGIALLLAALLGRAWAGAPEPRPVGEVQAVLAQAPKPPAKEVLRPLTVVLVADVKDHGPGQHDYPCWQKRWAVLLGGKGAAGSDAAQVNLHGPPAGGQAALAGAPKVAVRTAWKWPSDEQLQAADLLVMFCYRSGGEKGRTWSEARVAQLQAYLERGGGFVAIHPATYTIRDLARPASRRALALTGLGFDRTLRYRHGRLTLRVALPEHPICRGLPKAFVLHDEPYWPPVGDPKTVQVLVTSDETVAKGSKDTAPQPMFWTHRLGKGRVFGCVPGHFSWTFDDPYFRLLLLRGMAWAAGEAPTRFDPLVLRGAAVE